MKWTHLPMSGGLYDQHPGMLDRFYYILAERGKYEAQKQREREAKTPKPKNAGRSGLSRSYRR